MRIACVGYRDWALRIYDQIAARTDHQFLIFRSRAQYDEKALMDFKPGLALFYGWSWCVSKAVTGEVSCLMLHPSPLPRYRGGSPIQNQIIRGETKSMVTVFLMDEGIDTGPVVGQMPLSLDGNIADIFERMTRIGIELTLDILKSGLHPVPQDEEGACRFPRRKPADSELTMEELQKQPARYLYDKIRMLQSPYPNAYIRTADGKKLLICEAKIDDPRA
jgi:methionyl-tRNA formyltransferase